MRVRRARCHVAHDKPALNRQAAPVEPLFAPILASPLDSRLVGLVHALLVDPWGRGRIWRCALRGIEPGGCRALFLDTSKAHRAECCCAKDSERFWKITHHPNLGLFPPPLRPKRRTNLFRASRKSL
jgi:hypothetical protein